RRFDRLGVFAIGDSGLRGYNRGRSGRDRGADERTVPGLRNRSRTLMSSDEGGSVTCWLGHLREGDLAAAQPLWERYFSRLVVVARAKLKRLRRTTADEDEEDAALSAFNSFCDGAARGKFPQLADRDELWRRRGVRQARQAMG